MTLLDWSHVLFGKFAELGLVDSTTNLPSTSLHSFTTSQKSHSLVDMSHVCTEYHLAPGVIWASIRMLMARETAVT